MDIKVFNEMCEEVYVQKATVDRLKQTLKRESELLNEMQTKIMFVLDEEEMEQYRSPEGLVYKVKRESVRVPKTLEEKAKLFDWLKSKGVYDELITVNSVTLNALYKSEREKSDDVDFQIPGIGESTISFRLGMRSA